MTNAPTKCFYAAFWSFAFHAKPVLASSTISYSFGRLLRILEFHLAQLKWWEVIRSRSLCNPYVAKIDDPMTDGCQGKKDFLA